LPGTLGGLERAQISPSGYAPLHRRSGALISGGLLSCPTPAFGCSAPAWRLGLARSFLPVRSGCHDLLIVVGHCIGVPRLAYYQLVERNLSQSYRYSGKEYVPKGSHGPNSSDSHTCWPIHGSMSQTYIGSMSQTCPRLNISGSLLNYTLRKVPKCHCPKHVLIRFQRVSHSMVSQTLKQVSLRSGFRIMELCCDIMQNWIVSINKEFLLQTMTA
jgi:hypothetical protein